MHIRPSSINSTLFNRLSTDQQSALKSIGVAITTTPSPMRRTRSQEKKV
jgi:hypothetical protein